MESKKILLVIPRLHTNLLPLIKSLKRNNYSVSVFAFFTYKGKHSEVHDDVDIEIIGYSKIIKIIPPRLRLRLGIPSINCVRNIWKIKPDIVIVRDFVVSASIIHLLCKIKKIETVMYTQKPIYGWKPSILRQIYQYLLFPKHVFTTSIGDIEKKEVSINNQFIKRKWEYIPFVKEIESDVKNRKYFKGDRINILIVGKFTERKRILEFLVVFNTLIQERKDLYLTIAGSILDRNILLKIQHYIKENNLPVRIKISVPHHEMKALYLENDIFVLPAVREPASISQLEAMSFGLAVLCSNDNGTAYYIMPKLNGEVFDSINFHQDLERKIRWIITSRENIYNLGQASIKIVEDNHGVEKFINFLNRIS